MKRTTGTTETETHEGYALAFLLSVRGSLAAETLEYLSAAIEADHAEWTPAQARQIKAATARLAAVADRIEADPAA